MGLRLDHIIINVADISAAVHYYENLGFAVIREGIHSEKRDKGATLVFPNGTYLEFIAIDTANISSYDNPISQMIGTDKGLAGFALNTEDMEGVLIRLRNEDFEVSNVSTITREKNGRIVQFQVAMINNGIAPFIIQDITPKEWRIPNNDVAVTTHQNRAVGITAVEFVVRNMITAWGRFTRLLGEFPEPHASNYRTVGDIVLSEYMEYYSRHSLDELPDYLQAFAGKVPQEEINQADPKQEPKSFTTMQIVKNKTLSDFRKRAERERAMVSALKNNDEAFFAVHLMREEAPNDQFTLEHTHGVHFHQVTGVPASRGMDVLRGINEIDWSKVHHAYGPASDVPDLLRALTSDDKSVRNHAHEVLIGNIVHQGTIYEASIETIPFLVNMIDAPHVDNNAPLNLLGYITFGGIATPELKQATREKLDEVLPILIKNLSNTDAAVRIEIAENLRLYSSSIDILEPLLKSCIETDLVPEVRATCLATLVKLWQQNGDENLTVELTDSHESFVSNLMNNDDVLMAVRFRAALILMRHKPEKWLDLGMDILHQLMNSDLQTLESIGQYHWQGSIFYSVNHTLEDYPDILSKWVTNQASHPDVGIRQEAAHSLRDLMNFGISSDQILPIVRKLLRDPTPDVRQSAITVVYNSPLAREVIAELKDLAESDPSLTIRTMVKNSLGFLQ